MLLPSVHCHLLSFQPLSTLYIVCVKNVNGKGSTKVKADLWPLVLKYI